MRNEKDLNDLIAQEKPEIVVIGAGVAGFSAAMELSKRGFRVHLIEQNTLGSGASGRNPGRMGHGFHYVDIETAIQYLRSSIQVQRAYPGFLIGQDLPFNSPVRHGRYFITKDSDNSSEEILATYRAIQEEYARLIAVDPENEVFGPADTFFRILDPNEYKDTVNMDRIAMGVETAEHLFNWEKFLPYIRSKIESDPNISLYEHTKVYDIERGSLGEKRFLVHAQDRTGQEKVFKSDYLVNSTWQNIEYLNNKIDLRMKPDSRTNRLKTLLIVKLPESLKLTNSMFFCMGQHCMISNMGNGYAMMTFAKVTNMEASSDLTLSDDAERLLNEGPTEEEKFRIGKEMLHGISQYIPEMANAEIEDLKFGVVQTEGKLTLEDLRNKKSTFHKRNYFGVREEQVGVISNPCIKLFYFVANGLLVSDLIEQQIKATKTLIQSVSELFQQLLTHNLLLSGQTKKVILNVTEQTYQSNTILEDSCENFVNRHLKKNIMLSNLQKFSLLRNRSLIDNSPVEKSLENIHNLN